MLRSGEEQRDGPRADDRHDACGKCARALIIGLVNHRILMLISSLCITLPCAACQINSSSSGRIRRHEFPLSCRCQWHREVAPSLSSRLKRRARAILQRSAIVATGVAS